MDEELSGEVSDELRQLKEKVESFDLRLRAVESFVGNMSDKEIGRKNEIKTVLIDSQAPIDDQSKKQEKVLLSSEVANAGSDNRLRSEKLVSSITKLSPSVPDSPKEGDNLETRIGQYWLNRLGVVSLVVGVIFLILYSFQYFGVTLKLLTGFVIAAILIFFGEKTANDSQKGWFGHGLMGGGWGLAFFTAYAAYFIPELKIVTNADVELACLLSICVLALMRAVYFRAEIVASLAVALSVLSVCLSEATSISNFALIIVAIVFSFIALRQNWWRLMNLGILATYLGFSVISHPFDFSGQSQEQSIKAAFLFAYWLIFNAATCFSKDNQKNIDEKIAAASILNGISFVVCMRALMSGRSEDLRSFIIGGIGVLYLLSFLFLKERKTSLKTVHLLFGLLALNAAVWMKWTGVPVLCLGISEIALLVWAGLQFNIKEFSWFACFLAVICFFQWLPLSVDRADPLDYSFGFTSIKFALLGGLQLLVFAASSFMHHRDNLRKNNLNTNVYAKFYYIGMNMVAFFLPTSFLDHSWQKAFWVIQAVGNFFCAVALLDSGFYGFVGMCSTAWSVLNMLFQSSEWYWLPIFIAASFCYALFAYTLLIESAKKNDFVRHVGLYSAIAGNLIVTRLLANTLHDAWLSVGWALEGIALLAVGLWLREKSLRVFGLGVLALVLLKLLLVDLGQVGTIGRIISFIVAGIVFLFASYVYSRFSQKMLTKSIPGSSENELSRQDIH